MNKYFKYLQTDGEYSIIEEFPNGTSHIRIDDRWLSLPVHWKTSDVPPNELTEISEIEFKKMLMLEELLK